MHSKLISIGPGRRLPVRWLFALVLVVILAMGLPAPASGATLLRVVYATVDTTGHPVVGVESDRDIQKIVARFRIAGSQEVVATRDDFRLLRTQGGQSSWAGDTALSLDLGTYEIDVDVWNVDGEHVTRTNAGKYDTRIRTWFVDFSVTPTSVDYDMQDVTFKGRLLSGTPGADERPMAGVEVHAYWNSARTTTAADGSFTMTGRVNGAHVAAVYDGDPTHRSAESAYISIEHVAQSTRLSLSAPTSAAKGLKTTVTGMLERQRKGVWVPLPAETVAIAFHYPNGSWNWLTSVDTDARGRFTAAVMIPASGLLRAELMEWWALQPTNVYSDWITLRTGTTISSFNASPEPVAKGRAITVSGTLKRYVSAWGPLGGKTVYIYFRPYRSMTWSYKGADTSDRYGKFSRGFTASQDGTWMAKYKGSDAYLPATSASDYVDVR